jgi:DNA polymerase-3 subunit gamma/tau
LVQADNPNKHTTRSKKDLFIYFFSNKKAITVPIDFFIRKEQRFYTLAVMAEYIVSARKYRPSKFADLIGQEHISGTLQNAIKTEQLAHSFLFCGPRGVGKTTAARILAKTINCERITPEIEACNECASCVAFNSNSSFNIYELDAASNNSVDDIRQLVEQVRFPPQSAKYKIYIIDEVHMLSTAAFNAFLKTLEEPPAHCKFILATTEKHKILPTILSRCQIFDFRRMSIDSIVNHLSAIARKENIQAEEDALHIIAQKCDGGMRDALSMFDRLASFAGGKLTYASVLENLNVLDYDYFFKLTDSLLTQDVPAIMIFFAEIQKKGFEGDDLILGLCEHFRNLLFAQNDATVELMEVSEILKKRYSEQAKLASPSFLLNCLNYGNQCDIQLKSSKNKRLLVELTLLKMAYVNQLLDAAEASKKKINQPETELANIEAKQNKLDPKPSSPSTIPPKAQEVVTLRKSSKIIRHHDIDIHKVVQDTMDEEKTEVIDNSIKQVLTQETLEDVWKKNVADLKEKKPSLSNLMALFIPQLSNKTIALNVESSLQKQFFEEHISFLTPLFQSQFMETITFEIILAEVNGIPKNKLYTPQDKFKRLVELNPAIAKLHREFGLDFDYN